MIGYTNPNLSNNGCFSSPLKKNQTKYSVFGTFKALGFHVAVLIRQSAHTLKQVFCSERGCEMIAERLPAKSQEWGEERGKKPQTNPYKKTNKQNTKKNPTNK